MSDFPFPTAADPWLLWEGDCLLGMAELPDHSVDAVVTDPPYSIGLMGTAWDTIASLYDFTLAWARCAYRVMKPGAFLVAFSAPRTYHHTARGIEDAGFELRDQLMWLYGSGFPKSNTTHLKPAHEPIVLARKPCAGTTEANVTRWGTGRLNVDPCRIEYQSDEDRASATPQGRCTSKSSGAIAAMPDAGREMDRVEFERPELKGRFPANVLLDADAAAMLDEQAPKAGAVSPVRGTEPSSATKSVYGKRDRVAGAFHGDSGGASRFFYVPKAPRSERHGSSHPSVKPVDLMRWLCRLVTPPGGLVLDPFAGTGTTGQAAIEEGFRVILCEQEPQYVADINRRLTAKATA